MNLRNLIYLSGFVLLAVLVWLIVSPSLKERGRPEGVACTEDALLCPDGSYVSRGGPNCEFAACPGGVSFKTSTDALGNSFEYPDGFGMRYLDALDWPPVLLVADDAFSCVEAGSETARAGLTERRAVNGREYCVTKISEGAAGSVYTQYAYAFPSDSMTAILSFSIRFSQCGNFDEPEKGECEAELGSFDIDSVIDRIARSVRFAVPSEITE